MAKKGRKKMVNTIQKETGSVRQKTYDELLEESVEKAIREMTPESAKELLSRLTGYDKNGHLIED